MNRTTSRPRAALSGPRRWWGGGSALCAVLATAIGLQVFGGAPDAQGATSPTSNTAQYRVTENVPMNQGRQSLAAQLGTTHRATAEMVSASGTYPRLSLSNAGGTVSLWAARANNASGQTLDPATKGCLDNPDTFLGGIFSNSSWYVQGRTVECNNGDREIKVTFDPPVIDPVFTVGDYSAGTDFSAGEPSRSWISWPRTGISRINGSSPHPYQVDAFQLTSQLPATFTDYKFMYDTSGTVYNAGWPGGLSYLQVSGLITSVTFSWDMWAKIVKQSSSPSYDWEVNSAFSNYSAHAPIVDLSITKDGPAQVEIGDSVEWTVQVKNNSVTGSHGYVIRDAVPAGVDNVTLVSGPAGCTLSGRDLVCTAAPHGHSINTSNPDKPLLTGGSAHHDVPVVLGPGQTSQQIVLSGTATGAAGSTITNTAKVTGVDYDPNLANNEASVDTTLTEPDPIWSVAKEATTASGSDFARPGENITYRVTATGTAGAATGVQLRDDLSDVLSNADVVPGSVRLTFPDGNVNLLPAPTAASPVITTPSFTLAEGQTAVLTYTVRVRDGAWSAALANTVTGDGSVPPQTCAPAVTPIDPVCTTLTPTPARVVIVKQGLVDGLMEQLDGAGFEVLADDAGAPGGVITNPGVTAVAATTGHFEILGLEPGTYWLRETQAPAGYELLAAPVQFTVHDDGSVSLPASPAAPQVSAQADTITVTDKAALRMPAAGSSGVGPVIAVAVLLLLCAGALGVLARKRR